MSTERMYKLGAIRASLSMRSDALAKAQKTLNFSWFPEEKLRTTGR